MKISFTQKEIDKLVKDVLFSGKAVDVEVSIIPDLSKEGVDTDGWIKNTRTSDGCPDYLSREQIIETKWNDGDTLTAEAGLWTSGWNIKSCTGGDGDEFITHYRIVK